MKISGLFGGSLILIESSLLWLIHWCNRERDYPDDCGVKYEDSKKDGTFPPSKPVGNSMIGSRNR